MMGHHMEGTKSEVFFFFFLFADDYLGDDYRLRSCAVSSDLVTRREMEGAGVRSLASHI